jgi:hypothetical protein
MATPVMRRVYTAGAILASFAASAAYEYRASSDLGSVFGAQVAGCKKPCSDGNQITVNECQHDVSTDLTCGTDYCQSNILLYAKCTQGNAGPENQCKFGSNGDWWRTEIFREEPCDNPGGHVPLPPPINLGPCTQPSSLYTPCQTKSCNTGPVQGIITFPGKTTCA